MSTIDQETLAESLEELQVLNERYFTTRHLEFKAGRNGNFVAEIKNDHAEATISLEGGQMMTFQPRDQEAVLWLSPFAPLNPNKPIRGGIPVCWPWFGPHSTDSDKPAHGFARTALWTVVNTKNLDDGATQVSLELVDNEATLALWPYAFRLQLIITVGTQLQLELVTRNTGDKTFTIGEALHTYFNVSDVTQTSIHGLENCQYIDKVNNIDNAQRDVQEGAVTISAETDRIYLDTTADCVIEDRGLKRRIRIAKQGSQSTVVWNPWTEKAARLGDLGYQGQLRMLCIETANAADNVVEVAPGGEHCLQAVISVETLSGSA